MNRFENEKGFPISMVIGDKDDYLDKIERNTTSLSLLAKNDNFEIVDQTIVKEKIFMIHSDDNAFEFYYILDGKIMNKETGEILDSGSFISVQGEVNEAYFKTVEDSRILLVSTVPVFDSVEKRYNDLISLNDKVKVKDQETREHCKRLQELSLKTGEELELNDDQLFSLGYASFLHDIGKINIDSDILNKPGSLNSSEWGEMKKHSMIGKELIREYLKEGYFKDVAEIVCQHHEKFDGSGYPKGLKGEEIMIEARILTVVDAFDAMTSQRPYQDKISGKEALTEIKSCKGKHFCPKVVEAFIAAEKKYYNEYIKE